jgi:pyridoxal phosphate enzyme (YggS family)
MSNAYFTLKKQIPDAVQLVAVTKFRALAEIQHLIQIGQVDLAENKVQLLLDRRNEIPNDNIRWHLIGHLQSNKVKQIAPFIWMIHSVDSLKLIETINKEAEKNQRVINVLLQIKIAEEATKFGFDWEELVAILKQNPPASFPFIAFKGVMGMATLTDNTEQIRAEFKKLKSYFTQLKTSYFAENNAFTELSMGMSGDYQIAIEEGSTLLRIGSALFAS